MRIGLFSLGLLLPGLVACSPGPESSVAGVALEVFIDGADRPVFMAQQDGDIYVVSQPGRIHRYAADGADRGTFADLTGRVRYGGERGLLGLAFHPGYARNGRLFVYYTARNGDNTVAELRADPVTATVDPDSLRVLLAIPDFAGNHNGGMLLFGPDGRLYAGTGDGGGAGDPRRTAQDPDHPFGKLLRFDVDGTEPGQAEIYALGLRNPWRFSFDRDTGELFIGDVGQNAWEEIDHLPAGAPAGTNFGWSELEGSHCFRDAECARDGFTPPIAEYDHEQGCSVTGGYVYRGRAVPALRGRYLYGDFCSGRIWTLARDGGAWRSRVLLDSGAQIASFAEDASGELYVLDLGGSIHRVVAAR